MNLTHVFIKTRFARRQSQAIQFRRVPTGCQGRRTANYSVSSSSGRHRIHLRTGIRRQDANWPCS